MLKYFRLIKDLFLINPVLILKPLILSIIGISCAWHFVLKKPIYQRIYGKSDPTPLQIADADNFIPLPEQPIIPLKVNGYEIEVQAIKRFETTARVTYVDRYSALGTWYRSHEGAALYDAVVPQDISLATGKYGRDFHCFKFTHTYRFGGGFSEYKCGTNWQKDYPLLDIEMSNNHTIAYNNNVQKGIDILKAGDIAHVEGYLMYWNGTGNLRYQRFESAITPGQMSKYIVEGRHPGLCRQLLLTKLTFDGYTFE